MDLNPNKNYILGYHPHGIMSAGAFASFGTDTCGFMEVFPGIKPTLAVLAGLFMIPIFREYIMSGGMLVSALPFHTNNFKKTTLLLLNTCYLSRLNRSLPSQ